MGNLTKMTKTKIRTESLGEDGRDVGGGDSALVGRMRTIKV